MFLTENPEFKSNPLGQTIDPTVAQGTLEMGNQMSNFNPLNSATMPAAPQQKALLSRQKELQFKDQGLVDFNKPLSAYGIGSNALTSTVDTRVERNSRWQRAPSYLDDINDRDFEAELQVPHGQGSLLNALGSNQSLTDQRGIKSAIRKAPNTQLI